MQLKPTRTQTAIVLAASLTACVGIVTRWGFGAEALHYLALVAILAFASANDLARRIIPDACILAALGVRALFLAWSLAMGQMDLAQLGYYAGSCALIGAGLLVFTLAFERLTGHEGMGGGDVKLYAVAGWYFGIEAAVGVILCSCVLVLIASLISRNPDQGGLTRALPFGPAISLAMAIAAIVAA